MAPAAKRAKAITDFGAGDRRSIGMSNEIAASVLREPKKFAGVFAAMLSADPVVRMRAADAAEKVSRRKPELLRPFKRKLLQQAAEEQQIEACWHLAQMLPRLELKGGEVAEAAEALFSWMKSASHIVKVNAMQALADLAGQHAELKDEVALLVSSMKSAESAAVRARARKIERTDRRRL